MSDYLPINNETALQFKKAGGEEDSEDGGKSIEGACVYSEQIIDDVFIQPMIPILFKRKLENDNDNLFTFNTILGYCDVVSGLNILDHYGIDALPGIKKNMKEVKNDIEFIMGISGQDSDTIINKLSNNKWNFNSVTNQYLGNESNGNVLV